MRYPLAFFLLLLTFSTYSQTIQITGRCFYDANGNNIFDGTDSVLANRQVRAVYATGSYLANTNASGLYQLVVVPGSYDIDLLGSVATQNYQLLYGQHRDYTAGGSDIVDFAYQKRDSIESIISTIQSVNNNNVTSTGGTRQYQLKYGYDGFLQSIPATVTLSYNPKLTLISSSVPPSVTGSGKLQWNFPNVNRNSFSNSLFDSINLVFNYPAVGDTISSFILSPKFIPGIAVTSLFNYQQVYDFTEYIDFPATAPTGPTSGVKWLRHFAGAGSADEDGVSIDTAQNGMQYFIAGHRGRLPDSVSSGAIFPFIAKLNKDGLSIWEKYLDSLPGNNIFDWIATIKHTSDGGCMVLGTSAIYDTLGYYKEKILVARFDSSGNFMWSTKMNGSKNEQAGQDIVILPDGSCLVTGSTTSYDGDFLHHNADTVFTNLFITKLSPTGNILFTKVYGGGRDDYGYRIKPLQNGSFLLLGITESNNGDVVGAHQHGFQLNFYNRDTVFNQEAWLLNIDGNGNIIWSKCFGGTGNSFISGAADNNGGILLTGATDSKNGDLPYYPEASISLWILQISTNGNIAWSKLHKLYKGYQDSNYIESGKDIYNNNMSSRLHKTKDGNFVGGGTASDKYGPLKSKHGREDFLIAKINPAGDILWQKAVGGTDYDYLNDLQLDKNDDILFIGYSGSGNDDLYLDPSAMRERMAVGKLGITNIIKGHVFIDQNGNHIKDAGEPYYSQGRINSVKVADTIVARIFDGSFLNNVDTGNYISTYIPASNYYNLFPATHNTSFNSFDLTDSFDFALVPKPNINDLEVELLPLSIPRPGFDVTYRIITKNVGTTTINNVVTGFKKDSRQTYLSASRPVSGTLADSTWWGPFTLNAFGIDTLYVSFTLNTPPALNNGDTISVRVTANPVINDSSANNNIYGLKEIVRGSFDPNNKTEIHAGVLTTTQYAGGEFLQYKIQFQNTGTDTAFFITVKDTLQSGLNPGSMEIVSASYPYTFRLEGNIATWDFKKIKLPDSTTNEAGSHGFILFKIKPTTGLTVGDEFTNKAAIYFDYNLPVITNQDITVIGTKAGICPGANVSFIAGISGASYQWQENAGAGFTNLINAGLYSGVNTTTLLLTAPSMSMAGYRYRCVVNGANYSPENILKFTVRWNGAAGSAWETTANWDCGVMPDAQTEVIVPAGVTYPLISSNASCYSLRLSPGSIVTVKTGFKLSIMGKAN